MSLKELSAGKDMRDDFNVVIEIAANGDCVKYEVDKDSGLLMVDRIMPTAMHYPCNYGFVPSTLAADGDPVDVLVITPFPLQPGCLIRARAIGMLNMTDEAGEDAKVLALPIAKACAEYAHMQTLDDVSPVLLKSIAHFFENYKSLEPGKWVKVGGWESAEAAKQEIMSGVECHKG